MQTNTTDHKIPTINNGVAIEKSKSLKAQMGILAKQAFKPGDLLFTVTGSIVPERTRYTFQFGSNEHIDPRIDGKPGLGHYLNHACDPNAKVHIVRHNGDGYIQVVARKEITEGDEIKVDYSAMEYELAMKDTCTCGYKNCRNKIEGYKDLPQEIKKKYIAEGLIPQYLIELDKQK